MFKNLIRELHELGRGVTASMPIEADERGYIDKECPAPSCVFAFKVLAADWREKFRDDAVFCPRCRHEAPAKSWFTTEQVEQARANAFALAKSRLTTAVATDAREVNAQAPRGSVRITMKVPGARAQHVVVPVAAAAVLEQTLTCDTCGARCAVLGPAFFCPCCGHNSVERMFDGALAKVRTKIEGLALVRDTLRDPLGADGAETFILSIVEDSIQNCVVAFQHLAERMYVPPAGAKAPGQNAFQRLDEASQLWRAAIGQGYDDWLSAAELGELKVLFQRRHLLAHRDGLVDDKYVEKSGDPTYKPGQRIVVAPGDVLRMVALVGQLGTALRSAVRRSTPAPVP